jgi:hypothetical protein
MNIKSKVHNKLLIKAIIQDGREEMRTRFQKLSSSGEIIKLSMTDQILDPISRAAFGHSKGLEPNPLRVSDETLQKFLEADNECEKKKKSDKKESKKRK